MSYSMNQYISDINSFWTQFNSEIDVSRDNFLNIMSDMESMSDDEFAETIAVYVQAELHAMENAANTLASSPSVLAEPAASQLFQNISKDSNAKAAGMPSELSFATVSKYLQNIGVVDINEGISRSEVQKVFQKQIDANSERADRLKRALQPELEEIASGALWSNGVVPLTPYSDLRAAPGAGRVGVVLKLKKMLETIALWRILLGKNYRQPADPLVLDLDGDSIETIAVSAVNAVMYDYNGNEIKTTTGWSSPDDGFLVFDRDNNGIIDDASELFSDYTPLYAGGSAADGFAALAQEDSNKDGVVNNLDANWNNLKIWQDINSDGISQSEELFTMEEAGISGLNVAKSNINQTLPNGNSIKGTGTYIKNDGTTGLMGDVYFAVDTSNQQFPDTPVLPEVEDLPYLPGSGLMRDLHQAASLSPQLLNLLTQYSEAATRQEQMAIIDQLLYAWANTSGMAPTLESRDPEDYRIQYDAFGSITRSANIVTGDGGVAGGGTGSGFVEYVPDVENPRLTESYRQLISQWSRKLHILEAFSGSYFFAFPDQASAEGKGAVTGMLVRSTSSSAVALGAPTKTLLINLRQAQLNLLNQSYELLRQSVYQTLFYQTRFQTDFLPLLDNVELVFDEAGQLAWDYSGLEQYFADTISADPAAGMSDLLEFNRYVANYFLSPDWKGNEIFADYCRTLPVTPELQAMYASYSGYLHILGANIISYNASSPSGEEIIASLNTGASISGSSGDDILIGSTANDRFHGGGGDDYLSGNAGDDFLSGMEGNDTIKGGAGRDNLFGGAGNDVISGGSGNDVLCVLSGRNNTFVDSSGFDKYYVTKGSATITDDGGSGQVFARGGILY
jgi:hypothetical protein